MVPIYVDYIIFISPSPDSVNRSKKKLAGTLAIKGMGELRQFLGIEFYSDDTCAWTL